MANLPQLQTAKIDPIDMGQVMQGIAAYGQMQKQRQEQARQYRAGQIYGNPDLSPQQKFTEMSRVDPVYAAEMRKKQVDYQKSMLDQKKTGLEYAATILPTVKDQGGYNGLMDELESYGIDTRGLRGQWSPLKTQKLLRDLMPIKDQLTAQATMLGMEKTKQDMMLDRMKEARMREQMMLNNKPLMGKSTPNVDQYDPLVQKYAGDYAPIIKAMMKVESGGDKTAKSPKGATGLMQLMPETAQYLGVTDPNDPEQNIAGGARYFQEQVSKYGDFATALAAYNWGPANVDAHLEKYGELNYDALPEETKKYLSAVNANMQAMQDTTFNPRDFVGDNGSVDWEKFNKAAQDEGWSKDVFNAKEDQVKAVSKELTPDEQKTMTWAKGADLISQEFGTKDPKGQFFISPELAVKYRQAMELYETYLNNGLNPLSASNKAIREVRGESAPSISNKVSLPGKKVARTGVNKITGKKVVQYEDGTVEEVD